MDRIKVRNYRDVIIISNDPPEKIEEELAKLEEENKELKDWPRM